MYNNITYFYTRCAPPSNIYEYKRASIYSVQSHIPNIYMYIRETKSTCSVCLAHCRASENEFVKVQTIKSQSALYSNIRGRNSVIFLKNNHLYTENTPWIHNRTLKIYFKINLKTKLFTTAGPLRTYAVGRCKLRLYVYYLQHCTADITLYTPRTPRR